jgi:shikimate kinase
LHEPELNLPTAGQTPGRAIALIGMPGCGKSSVGRQISKQLGWNFADSDAEITRRISMPIRAYFEREGEARFREIEEDVIASLCDSPSVVIATGGGAVIRSANRDKLKSAATVVYLRSSFEDLWRRLRYDTRRPLLQVADPQTRLRELLRERDPLYRQTAHHVINAGRGTVQGLANRVLMQLELAGVVDAFRPAAGESSTTQ